LEHFIFYSPSLAPTKNYLSLAYELAKGAIVGLGKLFLGEVYRYPHLMSSRLLSQKRLKSWKISKREFEQPSVLSRREKLYGQLKAGSRGPGHPAKDRAYRVEYLESVDSIG
jgi:hypothetical protein